MRCFFISQCYVKLFSTSIRPTIEFVIVIGNFKIEGFWTKFLAKFSSKLS